MGNPIQNLSAHAALIAGDNTWIESDAIAQLIRVSQLPGMIRSCGMPDLHPGRGYPIGAAFLTDSVIYPALVGSDIGCGMSLWSTDLMAHKVKLDKLEKKIGNIDKPLDASWDEFIQAKLTANNLPHSPFNMSLGTIGGGNHFAELLTLDKVEDQQRFAATSINPKKVVLMVHSGSRGMGEAVLRAHVEAHSHQGLAVGIADFSNYLAEHNAALRFAELNRECIARRLLSNLGTEGERQLDVNHNLLTPFESEGQKGWLHRKGATPTDQGLVMIPGSRGDYSYLVEPQTEALSLMSLPHGAGRKWIRNACKGRLERNFTADQLRRSELGSRVICDSKALLYEEAPQAYKSIETVIEPLQQAGLLQVIARFKPLLTYKSRGSHQ